MRRIVAGAALAALAAALFLAGVLGARQGGRVDWGRLRAVAIHSDDWGLPGYVPSRAAADTLDVAALDPGRFPPAYLRSTLETARDVELLADLLAAHRGRDGLPAVFQPNYILGSQTYEPAAAEPWRERALPELPPGYARPGLWEAVDAARARGVWSPELHGLWHYDPRLRREAVANSPVAARAAADGVLLFPAAGRAHELGPGRPAERLDAEFVRALAAFQGLFDRIPASAIAPDYRWGERDEARWQRAGIAGVQAKREQRSMRYLRPFGRLLKAWERGWAKAFRPGRVYIERNARLETAQMPDPGTAARRCLDSVRAAWRDGRPAVIESHRLNYAHLDAAVADAGRAALAQVLADLGSAPPSRRPLYLSDQEIVALERRGVSARRAGGDWILRNATHARRPVILAHRDGPRIVWLAAGEMRRMAADTPSD